MRRFRDCGHDDVAIISDAGRAGLRSAAEIASRPKAIDAQATNNMDRGFYSGSARKPNEAPFWAFWLRRAPEETTVTERLSLFRGRLVLN